MECGRGCDVGKPGDKVIPCYTPQCREADCIFCASPKTNLCPKIRGTQGQAPCPTGRRASRPRTARRSRTSWAAQLREYTVVSEISCAKISDDADLETVCMLGEGGDGLGRAWRRQRRGGRPWRCSAWRRRPRRDPRPRSARRIFAIDVSDDKKAVAEEFGATDFLNPTDEDTPIQQRLVARLVGRGLHLRLHGVEVMRAALEAAHSRLGRVRGHRRRRAGKEIATRRSSSRTRRKGTAFGGFKSRDEVPPLVDQVLNGELPIDVRDAPASGVENTLGAVRAPRRHAPARGRVVLACRCDSVDAAAGLICTVVDFLLASVLQAAR